MNLKLNIGIRKGFVVRNVQPKDQIKADLRKVICGIKKQIEKELRALFQIIKGCLGKNTQKKQKKKCQKAASIHITTRMADTMEKSIQKNAIFAENQKKEYLSIIKMATDQITTKLISWLFVINATARSIFQTANLGKIWRGD